MHQRLSSRRRTARLAPGTLLALVALLLAACGGGPGGIVTSDPWVRASPMVAGAGAAYVVIENTGSAADALIGARSDVAATTEVHETYAVEPAMPAESMGMGDMASPMASGGTDAGSTMLGMRRIERVEIPAGGRLELKPGGHHLMLIDLARELRAGETIDITLVFENAGEIRITAVVRGG